MHRYLLTIDVFTNPLLSANCLIISGVCFVYSHLVQLFIDFLIILIVFTKLGDQCTICQSKQLRVLWQKAHVHLKKRDLHHNINIRCSILYIDGLF